MMRAPKNAATGTRKETDVRRWLQRNGWDILKRGTRGPADIIAQRGGTRWFIQIKYTRKTSIDPSNFAREMPALKRMASMGGGTAVLCLVVQGNVWFTSARTGETLRRGFL